MSPQQFKQVSLLMTVGLGIVFGFSIVNRSYVWPIIAALLVILTMFWLRRRVQGVVADERDYAVGGQAARLAIQAYSWLAAVVMVALYAQRDLNPAFEPVAATLAYSTCFLMLVYSLIFKHRQRHAGKAGDIGR